VVKVDLLHSTPSPSDLASAIVYSAQSSDVQTVIIDGKLLMLNRRLLTLDEPSVIEEANREAEQLKCRAINNDQG